MYPVAMPDGHPDIDALMAGTGFCAAPWAHLCASVDGLWGRCCVDSTIYRGQAFRAAERPTLELGADNLGCISGSPFAADNPHQVRTATQAFDSPAQRATRRAMLAGTPVDACRTCTNLEVDGGRSYRQQLNDELLDSAELRARVRATDAEGRLHAGPTSLDLRLGNTCNLTCTMCEYPTSSRWHQLIGPTWAPAILDPYRGDGEFWGHLRAIAPDLRHLSLAGGEPLIQPGHRRLLDLLIEEAVASGIELHYTTNLTIIPEGLWERLARFRSVDFGVSCDGVGAVFEAIRRGASWDRFTLNLATARRHVQVSLQASPQLGNVDQLGTLVDWAHDQHLPLNLRNLVRYPRSLSVEALPEHRRPQVVADLDSAASRARGRGEASVAESLETIIDLLGGRRAPVDFASDTRQRPPA